MASGWQDIWKHMTEPCRDEIVLIEAGSLLSTLDNYLRKHRYIIFFTTIEEKKLLEYYTQFLSLRIYSLSIPFISIWVLIILVLRFHLFLDLTHFSTSYHL